MPGMRRNHGRVSTHASVRRRHSQTRKTSGNIGFNSRLREEAPIMDWRAFARRHAFQLTPP